MFERPTITADASEHADWLEFDAMRAEDGCASFSEYSRSLNIEGSDEEARALTVENEVRHETLDDTVEVLMDDVNAELVSRQTDCGGNYPFTLTSGEIDATSGWAETVYTFQLLLSMGMKHPGEDAEHGERLFEEVCAEALARYLGCADDPATTGYVFGFPRRVAPSGFRDAVDDLCSELREGEGAKDAPETSDQKDAGLDIVVWKDLADRRAGKLIVFGQCATGRDWKNKLSELQPEKWCELWLKDILYVNPSRSFFLPHVVDHLWWRRANKLGGVVFDRCRTASLLAAPSEDIVGRVTEWIAAALPGDDEE